MYRQGKGPGPDPRRKYQKYMTFPHISFGILEEGFLFGFLSEVQNSWILGKVGRQGMVWAGCIVLVC